MNTFVENLRRFLPHPGGDGFFANSIVQWLCIGIIMFHIVLWSMTAFFIRPQDDVVILHYNSFFGVDIVGSWWYLYALPTVLLAFFVINMLLAYWCYTHKERVAAYILLLGLLLAHIGLAIALVSLIIINR